MTFNQYLGKYVCGNLPEMEYPELGVAGIVEGFESKHLGILAGMNRSDETSELRKYLKWTIEELNITLPNKRDAALLYSNGIVDEILNEKKDVINGVYEIKNYAIDSYDFRTETNKYLFDSIGFERIYGLYIEFEDLNDSFEKESNRNLMSKIKAELLTEIKIWQSKLKNGV